MLLWLISIALADDPDPGGPIALGAGVQGNLAPTTPGNVPPLAPMAPGIRLHLGQQAMIEVAGFAGLRSESATAEETDADDLTSTTTEELGGFGLGGGAHLRVRAAYAGPTSAWLGIGASGSRWHLSGEEVEQDERLDRTVTTTRMHGELSLAAIHEIAPRLSVTADLGLVPWARASETEELTRRGNLIARDESREQFVGAWLRGALWVHVRL